MFSRLRRSNNTPAAPPPIINEPPPPAASRREKERSWLASIARRDGKKDRGIGHTVPPARRGSANGADDSAPTATEKLEDGAAGTRGAPSIRSRRSFRIGGGKGKDRTHDGATSRAAQAKSVTSSGPPQENDCRQSVDRRRPSSSAPPATSSSAYLSPSPAPAPTQNLAQRLQELAVANADGLLDEDEYRMLRTQLFESLATSGDREVSGSSVLAEGSLAVPRLGGPESSPPFNGPTPSPHLANPPSPPQPSSPPQRAPSVLSAQSRRGSVLNLAGALFRKPTGSVRSGVESHGAGQAELASPVLSDGASTFSARVHGSHRANHTDSVRATAPTSPSLNLNGHSAVRTRSIRNHPGMSSSALDLRSSRSVGGESVFSASTEGSFHRSAYRSPASLSPSKPRNGGTFVASIYSQASSHASSSRLEMLSYTAPSLPPIPSSSDPTVFAAATREPSSKELLVEIDDIDREWRRMSESWNDALDRAVRKWRSAVGDEVVERLGGLVAPVASPVVGGGVGVGVASPVAKKGLFRRASFNVANQQSPPSVPSPPPPPAAPLPPWLSDPPTATLPSDLPDDIDLTTRALVSEVENVRQRQQQTNEKYERRLEFLRARLRAAEIRERLKA
ncbi:hypothetical protein JCM10207_008677 [Rhodosporidiobolus poonsookiae]